MPRLYANEILLIHSTMGWMDRYIETLPCRKKTPPMTNHRRCKKGVKHEKRENTFHLQLDYNPMGVPILGQIGKNLTVYWNNTIQISTNLTS